MSAARDLVVKVRLMADGSGLVGQTRPAVAAIDDVRNATTAAAAAARGMAGATTTAATATSGAASAGRQAAAVAATLANETRQAGAAFGTMATISGTARASMSSYGAASREVGAASDAMATELRQAKAVVDQLQGEMATLRTEIDRLANAQRGGGKAANDNAKAMDANARSAGQVKAGYFSLGQNMQDVGVQMSMGTDLMRIMAMQGGQLATAVDMIGVKGAGGRLAAFLAGPYGAVVLTATAILGPMIVELVTAKEAMQNVEIQANALSSAQSALGEIFDLTTGKLKSQTSALASQNEQLRINARLTAVNLRVEAAAEAKSSKEAFDKAGQPGALQIGLGVANVLTGGSARQSVSMASGSRAVRNLGRQLRDADKLTGAARTKRFEDLIDIAEDVDFKGSGLSKADVLKAIGDRASARSKTDIADRIDRSLDSGVLDTGLRQDGRAKTPPKPKSTVANDEFGRDAADRIAGIVGQFVDAPDIIERTNAKVRELDDLIEDLRRRKPPGFEDLAKSAEAAKSVVRNGLIATIGDAFDKPRTLGEKASAALSDLDTVIADLRTKKPVDWERSVAEAERAKGKIADALQEPFVQWQQQQDDASQVQQLLIAGKVDEAEATAEVLRQARLVGASAWDNYDAILAGVRARRDEAAALDRVYRRQDMYLQSVRDVRGAIEDATQAWVRGDLREFVKTPKKLFEAYQQLKGRELFEGLFGDAFAQLERALTEGPVEKASRRMAGEMDGATAAVRRFTNAANGSATEIMTGQPADTGETVITGKPPEKITADSVMRDSLTKIATEVTGIFTSKETAQKIGSKIGEYGGKAMAGVATGSQIAGFAQMLGMGKSFSGTGAQIGGAIGSFLPIPGGKIIGSIAGGLIGGLVKGPTRSGYAAITTDAAGNGASSVAGGRNSEGRKKDALTYADAVLDGLDKIASGLGGRLGSGLDLGTIGSQGDKFVFDPDGAGAQAGQKFGTIEEAVSAAMSAALGKGAVEGLSDAVRKALGSSTDIDKAVAEALQVKQLETLIGGVGGQLNAMFREFDGVAAERVRLANTYGLDLLAVEKKNAEERSKLVEQTLTSRVGSLKQLLKDMEYGDMFEGDASTRRAQILAEITDARQDADAGVDGAGDRLAELYRLLIETSKEAYGTAGGELSADRKLAGDGAAAVIKAETDRINAASVAQAKTTSAVESGNKLLNEISDQLAVSNARLGQIAGSGGTDIADRPVDYSLTLRRSELI
ncbi:hypothetical protein ASE73_02545 [Sphingomonas sp. Leaf24]|uniref:hypothetical protein n=1 Tax=unclassified Sphingomonas TaxID=196159 RepID=UPI0006F5E4BE|nr:MULTISPECIES: hypothetical protein [unclassified Sphingomonas]KQM23122.1 hypothetical protein ASE50_02545 [Sphingomonas sp. Leaf5]KQM95980.1 hypothetical protein ASE73_02545 [Sphingomonas sp. Leaf24]